MQPPEPGLLGAVAEELSPVLVPPQTRQHLLRLDARLPALDNARYLECRLGVGASNQVDYLMSLTRAQADFLGRELTARGLAGPGMAAVARLCEDWGGAGDPAFQAVPLAWLEFDHVERQEIPAASPSICLAPAYVNPFAMLERRPAAVVVQMAADSVHLLRGRPLDATETLLLQRAVELLPDGAHWIHFSVMSARTPVELKLYGVFPLSELLPYLRAVAWTGTLTTLSQFLRRYYPASDTGERVYVDLPLVALDPGANANTGLGLVHAQQQVRGWGGDLRGDPGRKALLATLVADGLCTPAQEAALKRWITPDGSTLPTRRWMDVKVVYHDARPTLAKAYLGFTRQRPLRAGL